MGLIHVTLVRFRSFLQKSANSTTRANLECLPIFQGEAPIFVPHPCLHDQTDTEDIQVSNSNTCRSNNEKLTNTTSWSRGKVLARRTASQTACADSSAYYRHD
jgi:hypothetical protein